jgi:hypothetical protein
MEAEQLRNRRAELVAHAEERGIDWRAHLEEVPTDEDQLSVLLLADLLRFDFERVFDADTNLVQLARESYRLELQRERAEEESRREAYSHAMTFMESEEFRYGRL